MSYSEHLASRIRATLRARKRDTSERKMFGGICFMVNGAMCCGVLGDELIVRVGPAQHDSALAEAHARVFDFSGRPSKGMVFVAPQGIATDNELSRWLDRGLQFLAEAPAPKKRKPRKTSKRGS